MGRGIQDLEPIGAEGDVYLTPMSMEPMSAEPATDSKPKTRKRSPLAGDQNGNMIAEVIEREIDGQGRRRQTWRRIK